jgi:Xaa-Pro aminopeptidase
MERKTYLQRLERCRQRMEEIGVHLLALTPGPNMTYMTGFMEEPGERLLTALFPLDGEPIFIVPELYEEQVSKEAWIEDMRAWRDSEDPLRLLGEALEELKVGHGRVALDTKMWARFVLMFRDALPGSELLDAAVVMDELRIVKGAEEIEAMRRGFEATDRAMGIVIDSLEEGLTEREVASRIQAALMECGADSASFAPIASSGPNGSKPHYRYGDRRLRPGDAIVLDFGGVFAGYYTDITRTVFLRHASGEQRRVYGLVREANEVAVEEATSGTPAEEVDRAARRVITDGGYGRRFIHRTGHGIGLEVHEEPYIVEGNRRPLEDGMTFSVEPGIYIPDNFGVRIENIVFVSGGKARRFDEYTRDLQVI